MREATVKSLIASVSFSAVQKTTLLTVEISNPPFSGLFSFIRYVIFFHFNVQSEQTNSPHEIFTKAFLRLKSYLRIHNRKLFYTYMINAQRE